MNKTKSKITIKDILDPTTKPEKRLIPTFSDLKKLVKTLKENGYRIVLTQGVWDLIHEGHALYLEKAKSHGDILIVGVDSDELTKSRKGPKRPIVPEGERIRMISHLRHVDIIALRNLTDDMGDLIRTVEPDVLIVSTSTNDFTDQMKKEYNGVCKKIVNLKPQATTSTTSRIRNLSIEGAEDLAEQVKDLTEKFINKIKNG